MLADVSDETMNFRTNMERSRYVARLLRTPVEAWRICTVEGEDTKSLAHLSMAVGYAVQCVRGGGEALARA